MLGLGIVGVCSATANGVKQVPDPGTLDRCFLWVQSQKSFLGPLLKCRTVFHFSAIVKISILFFLEVS